MTLESQDPLWERLSKALFSVHKMEDEGLFTYRVMQPIRRMQQAQENSTWYHFLRWAVPVLGVGVASLVLATRTPSFSYQDPINVPLEDWR